jgi:hypothetical protein
MYIRKRDPLLHGYEIGRRLKWHPLEMNGYRLSVCQWKRMLRGPCEEPVRLPLVRLSCDLLRLAGFRYSSLSALELQLPPFDCNAEVVP